MFDLNSAHKSFGGSKGIPAGKDGLAIELNADANYIQWRYKGFAKWNNIVAIKDLKGDAGSQGKKGEPGARGDPGVAGSVGPQGEEGKPGFIGPTGPKGAVGPRGFPGDRGVPGKDGSDGKNGIDGREIELQTSKTHIQWRYVGQPLWKNLIALTELKGPKGDRGAEGVQGERGLRGPQGWGGPAGTKGDTGALGPAGPQGIPGVVQSLVPGNNIDIDDTDPANPIIAVEPLTKADVGLNNVDNTSDPNKPISIATQAALDAKIGEETAIAYAIAL